MRQILSQFLLLLWLPFIMTNRVYVHPFGLFALDNVSCETVKDQAENPLKTVDLTLIESRDSAEPEIHDRKATEGRRQSITKHTMVLASLQNSFGLRLYHALRKQKTANALFSPINTFGALVTLYFGASKHTATHLQHFLGLVKETDKEECISPFDGHKVLRTLLDISSLAEGAAVEIKTMSWTLVSSKADLSEEFARGTREFSDNSYIRAVDFSQTQEAEAQVNSFIQRTSSRKTEHMFKTISPSADLLFASSLHFKGKWIAFHPEATSLQDFWIDEKTSVKVPLMTHTGDYKYLNDKSRRCTIIKLPLSEKTYMLLVLPHQGTDLDHIEAKLSTEVISTWHQQLKEGFLEVSLPKFSIKAVNDLRVILSHMKLQDLLGKGANFQRLSTKDQFNVDQVLNKAMFEMSESVSENQDKTQEGRVALKLTVNRPFCFTIIEGNTDAILLLGRVTNPMQ
ncbi:hypothetical protein MATL_G00020770 [Megalops atlanticus]|uniref:Angiotensinogen n=1 Tax=Megalops atlanticus TaxID=7932 RepID=A0A9D3QHX2_MEGAT|nr:hypothetical protein MATL_G00020770 [Megalops atlanticus]